LRWQAKLQQLRSPQSTTIEGDVSRYVYIAPNTTSALEIRRNYEQALGSQGFRVLYACAEAACGTPHANIYNDKSAMPRSVWGRINFRPAVFQFLAARSESRHVLVMIGEYVNPGDPHHHHPVIYQIVIEPNAAKTGQVTVDASAMSEAIAASGKALLYGLYFDTDSAVLKSESQPQLKELAAFLRTNAKMSVLIVGHTDSQGKLDYNVRLSERRAAAVVKALVGEHGIAAGRLTARGVGMLAPVASNRNEAGRAKNRRVEIVEHGP
jgi:outer membrane protein OmpA-like peptidoglycan-associated protein